MKKFLSIIILLLACSMISAYAGETFKILYLNTPEITIGGRQLKVGNTFDSESPITFSSDKQAMKVISLDTNKQRVITARDFKAQGSNSLMAYLKDNKKLSSRDGIPLSLVDLRVYLKNEPMYLLDCIEVATTLPTDNSNFFYLTFMHDGEKINKMLKNDNGTFIIDRGIYTIDSQPIPVEEMEVDIMYYDLSNSSATLIADGVKIIPLDIE